MKEKPKFIKSERRSFLKGAAVVGGAAAVAAPVSTLAATDSGEPVKPEADKGYLENDYIRDYYKLARF